MTDTAPAGPPPAPAPIRAAPGIDRIDLRDLSFESPREPGVFASEWRPQFRVELDTRARPLEDGRFKIVPTLTLEAASGGNARFVAEWQQAGIFRPEGMDEERRREALGGWRVPTRCPQPG